MAFNTATNGASDIHFLGFNPGSKLYLPVASSMNTKQTNPYMNLITGWYKDNDDNRWSMTNPSVIEFTTLQNDALIGEYSLVAGYETKPLTPDTGDRFNQNVFASMMILSGLGLVVLTKKYKKKESN